METFRNCTFAVLKDGIPPEFSVAALEGLRLTHCAPNEAARDGLVSPVQRVGLEGPLAIEVESIIALELGTSERKVAPSVPPVSGR